MQALRSPRMRRLLLVMLILCVLGPPLLARWTEASTATAAPRAVTSPGDGGLHDTVRKANGSGIRVRFRADGVAAAGLPFPVTLYFDAVDDPSATLRLSADAGLRISASALEMSLPVGSSELTLAVTPSADGLAYLNVFTMQHDAGGVTSIPIQVGAAQPKLPMRGTPKLDAEGQPTITFKAR